MNSNMVKPEKFDHLHLVYHITVPLNIKDVIFQQLQENNLKLKERVSCLEDKAIQLEIKNNFLEQYQRNNLEIEGIPTSMSDDELVKTAVAILNSINNTVLMWRPATELADLRMVNQRKQLYA